MTLGCPWHSVGSQTKVVEPASEFYIRYLIGKEALSGLARPYSVGRYKNKVVVKKNFFNFVLAKLIIQQLILF